MQKCKQIEKIVLAFFGHLIQIKFTIRNKMIFLGISPTQANNSTESGIGVMTILKVRNLFFKGLSKT